MRPQVVTHTKVRTVKEADKIAADSGCTHRCELVYQGNSLGFSYWVGQGKKAREKATYYSELKVVDVWAEAKYPEPLPADAVALGEEQ